MKGDQTDEPKAEPASISMMNEDPTHLAGRLEEYETLSANRPPNFGMFHEWELKEKFEAVVKAMRSRRRLIRWGFNYMARELDPRWSERLYDARFERMFLDEPKLMPSEAAMRVIGTLRMPLRMKRFIVAKARRVKNRLEQRQRDQAKRELRKM